MARIVLADDGIEFDGRTLETRPLGGVESSVTLLTRELARRGHQVAVRNNCAEEIWCDGVHWAPIHAGGAYANLPDDADLYIANRGHRLIPLMPAARRTAFWTHNPCRYVLKWRYLKALWRVRPVMVFIGDYHATTLPAWVPDGGRAVIPYGLSEAFLRGEPAPEPPGPRAIFTSNPLRGLDWLLDLWTDAIRPRVPDAELHVFSGSATYGAVGEAKRTPMERILKRAQQFSDQGVKLRQPVPKMALMEELRAARMMLYRGDLNETFCLAVGEAQAMGVPAVVQDLGSVVERVIHGETGFVAPTDATFADAAVQLFSDDALWRRQHAAALTHQRAWTWARAAESFERLLP